MALLMVLGVLATTTVLIAHLMLFSQVISKEAYQISRKGLLRYQAESAADTAFWMHLTDRRLFSNRTLGQSVDDPIRSDADFPPWMLDGRPHEFDEGLCTVYLNSAENGIRVDSLNQLKAGLDASDDADIIADIDDFAACYADYCDTNDFTNVNGFERDDYEAEGFPTLPRNNAMRFKAELYWLPNWHNVLTRQICIIPPRGISYRFSSNKPSIFNASAAEICQYLNIDRDSNEFEAVMQAINEWQTNGTPLDDTMDFELLTQVRSSFTFAEPGLALVVSTAYDSGREIHAAYRVTREAKMSSRTFFADRHKECLSIWERRWE